MKLRTLLLLQFSFAALSLLYLTVSLIRVSGGSIPLSAAPIIPSMLAFGVYCGFLSFGIFRRYLLYRITMAIAVLGFGYGGVVVNILNYFNTGVEGYLSFTAWLLALVINSYGTLWNIMAMLGLYKRP